MTEILIRVDAAKRSLTVASSGNNAVEPMSSRVSWVFAFLGLLIEASRRDLALDEAMLHRTLAALGQSPALNRGTLSRLVREAGRLLDVARSTGNDAGQLSFGPRAMTTGPWRWVMSAEMLSRVEVVWPHEFDVALIFSAAGDAPRPLSIVSRVALDADLAQGGRDPGRALAGEARPGSRLPAHDGGLESVEATLACIRAALAADRKMLAGDYGVAAEGFVGLLARTDLSAEFRHVMLLRQQRAERRAGEFGAARETLESLLQMVKAQPKVVTRSKPLRRANVDKAGEVASLPTPNASWLRWVADACRVAALRLDYDTAPRLNFGAINSQLASFSPASSPIGEWAAEAHSLRSLTLRRRAVAAANAGETAAAKALAAEAWQHNSSALLMAYAARDHDNVQNFLVNAGILFSELHDHKIEVACASGASGASSSALTALALAMRFYELSLECADHFMCGEDTAWEHVALGGLWLSNPGERAALQVNAGMALRSDRLGSAAFFVAGVARAERCGTPRQQVGAITNLWLFASEGGDAALMRRARKLLIEMISGGHAVRALYDGPEHSPLFALFDELELPTTKRRKSGRKTGW